MDLAGAIQLLRLVEENLSVVPIMDDGDAKKLASAWAMYPRLATKAPRAAHPDPDDRARFYDWAWSWIPRARLEAVLPALASRAGIAYQQVEAKFDKLLAARAIYPDGSLSEPMRRALNAYVHEHLPKAMGRPPAPAKEPRAPKTEPKTTDEGTPK